MSLAATPLILKKLGDKEFGVYLLILGFLSYSFVFSIGRSVTKFISEYNAVNESEKIAELMTAIVFINLAVSLTAIILMSVGAKWFIVEVLRIEPEFQETAVEAFYLSGFIISAALFSQIYAAVLQAFQRFDIYSLILVVTNSVSIVGNILIVYEGGKIRELFVWNLLTTFLTAVVYFNYAARMLKNIGFVRKISSGVMSAILKYNSAVFFMQIFGNLLVLFERSWITRNYGSEALTYYIVPMNLSFLIHIFINSFIIVIFPVASESEALGERENLLAVYKKATKLVITLSGFFAVTMIACRFPILQHYVGENFAEKSGEILIFHTLTFSLLAVATVFWQIVEGFGYPQITALLSFIWFAVSVPLMIYFTYNFSIESLSIARFIGVLIFIPALLYSEKKIFGGILWKFWRKIIVILTLAGTAAFVCEWNINRYFTENLTVLFFSAAAGLSVYTAVLLLSGYFEREEKLWIRNLAGRFF